TTLSAPCLTTPVKQSRRRERALSETPAVSSKKARVSGAEAISSLTASISRFGDNMCKVLAGDPSERTPQRHRKALQLAQKEKWLSARDRLTLCKIIEKDIKAADAYLALDLDDAEFRELWIQEKVEEGRLA
ncbi:hypothetical protein H0H93_010624, partial [Arthromyces matolae]